MQMRSRRQYNGIPRLRHFRYVTPRSESSGDCQGCHWARSQDPVERRWRCQGWQTARLQRVGGFPCSKGEKYKYCTAHTHTHTHTHAHTHIYICSDVVRRTIWKLLEGKEAETVLPSMYHAPHHAFFFRYTLFCSQSFLVKWKYYSMEDRDVTVCTRVFLGRRDETAFSELRHTKRNFTHCIIGFMLLGSTVESCFFNDETRCVTTNQAIFF